MHANLLDEWMLAQGDVIKLPKKVLTITGKRPHELKKQITKDYKFASSLIRVLTQCIK